MCCERPVRERGYTHVCVGGCTVSCSLVRPAPGRAMAKQGPIVVNEILCYIQGVRNTATVRQIYEAVISLFNKQKLHAALLLYHEHRGKGLILRARTSEKHIKCILDWMLEDEADTGIPQFVADNIAWLYPVDPKLWWLSPGEGWDAVWIILKKEQLLKIKTQVSSIWSKGCMLMIECVCYLT